ncbi:Hypothetical protein ETEE_1510 [Edwardsiella anguillarum ET080813]|uniref:Uncharacterized protein n=1 Tax=Edwardsiella anguillarum ET080813 TaxID=667120 RepID=A0A076LJ13_9GAMM|nr:Hypothetical protein ETEE_1510 [Edwardsiella anguillarum ET080813]
MKVLRKVTPRRAPPASALTVIPRSAPFHPLDEYPIST